MNARHKQTGAALLISLSLLLLLTIIAIAAAYQSSLQVRMATNSQEQNTAFQAAESGIQAWIENFKKSLTIAASPDVLGTVSFLRSSDGSNETQVAQFIAKAASPGTCEKVVPAYSLDAAEDSSTFQFACFNIVSRSNTCVDTDISCSPAEHPARAEHRQGHLVRY